MHTARTCAVLAAAAMVAACGLAAPPASVPADRATPTQRLAREHARVTLDRMPLEKVLAEYAKLSGLKLEADWAALKAAGIAKTTPVTLKAYGLTFEKLLDLTLDSIARKNRPLAWHLSGDTVHVSTQMRILHRDRPLLAAASAGRAAPRAPRRGTLGEIHFPGLKLQDVMEFIRDLSGWNVHVNWGSLEVAGITRDTPVTLKVRGVSLQRLLDLVIDQLSGGRDRFSSVYWVWDEGVVHIATGDALNRTTRTRIYDVSDLLMPVPNFQGPRISMDQTSSQSGRTSSSTTTNNNAIDLFRTNVADRTTRTTDTSSEDRKRELREGLIESIKNSIGEEMWLPTGKGSIKILRGKMIISQTLLGFKLMEKSLAR